MTWKSVRLRLTLINMAVMAILMAASGAALCYRVQQELSRSIDSELVEHAHIAQFIAGDRVRGDKTAGLELAIPIPELAPPPAATAGTDSGHTSEGKRRPGPSLHKRLRFLPAIDEGVVIAPRLFTTDAQPWVEGDQPWDVYAIRRAAQGDELFTQVEIGGVPTRVFTAPVRRRGTVVGVVQAAHALSDLRGTIDGEIRTLWLFLPFSLLVAGAIGIALTGRALKPVREITQTAAEIQAEDLSRRLEIHGEDELAELSRTFNGMIMRLQGAFGALESAYQRLRIAYDRLEGAYQQQRRFASDASHELRTPLTRLKAITSLALSAERTAPDYRRALEVADRSADSMGRIVEDLLLLARADAAQLRLATEIVPLEEVLRMAMERVRDEGAAAVSLHPSGESPAVLGDTEHLVRVFVNLLENSLDHTPATGNVYLFVRVEDGEARVCVQDTGEGIAAEHLPHVCERFYRADESRSRTRGGTGLGLAICQSILFAHGGSMSVESELGWGTRIRVTLPLVVWETEAGDHELPEFEGVPQLASIS